MIRELTKSEEITQLDNFIAERPSYSYLRSILGRIRPAIVTAIQSDLGWIHYNPHSEEREKRDLAAAIVAARADLAELGRELAAGRRALAALASDFENMSGDVRTIGRIAADKAATLKKALA